MHKQKKMKLQPGLAAFTTITQLGS